MAKVGRPKVAVPQNSVKIDVTPKISVKTARKGCSLNLILTPDAPEKTTNGSPRIKLSIVGGSDYTSLFKVIKSLYRDGIKACNIAKFNLTDDHLVTVTGRNISNPTVRGYNFHDGIVRGEGNSKFEMLGKMAGIVLTK